MTSLAHDSCIHRLIMIVVHGQ